MSRLKFPMFTRVTEYDTQKGFRHLSKLPIKPHQLCWESHSFNPNEVKNKFGDRDFGETELCIVLPYENAEDIAKIDKLISKLSES